MKEILLQPCKIFFIPIFVHQVRTGNHTMKAFILLTAILAVVQALPLSEVEEQQWNEYKLSFEKQYDNEEETTRKEIFAKNLRKFEEHNKKYEAGLVSYTLGVNQFADMTEEEFANSLRPMNVSEVPEGLPFVLPSDVQAPASMDWRAKGAVTPIKQQGTCGSCYTYSAAAALEGHFFIKTGRLISLSEQNLLDCTTNSKYGNKGCDGGVQEYCFNYVKDNGGIDTEQSYPYEMKVGQCRYDPKNSAGTIRGSVRVPQGNENALQNAVGTIGPVAVTMNFKPFQSFQRGIFDKPCPGQVHDIDHAVLVVGYGTENGKDYWLLKNSHGVGFGEQGYFRLARNKNNLCGIATQAVYPVV